MTRYEAIDFLINTVHLEDYVYYVRERATEERTPEEHGVSSWELPLVKGFSEAVEVLKGEL